MSWTDERVELLKKLWMDGLSASQIAGELGEGVTRNAVIGKVHRLKLSGRAKPATSSSRPRNVNRPARRSGASVSGGGGGNGGGGGTGGGGGKQRRVVTQVVGATALKASTVEEEEAVEEVRVDRQQELYVPPEERIGLLGLNESTCKWPIGDPLAEDFYFCGRESDETSPYCEFHQRRAYHQPDRKKK